MYQEFGTDTEKLSTHKSMRKFLSRVTTAPSPACLPAMIKYAGAVISAVSSMFCASAYDADSVRTFVRIEDCYVQMVLNAHLSLNT